MKAQSGKAVQCPPTKSFARKSQRRESGAGKFTRTVGAGPERGEGAKLKYLLLGMLLAFVATLVYFKLRPYLSFARRVFALFREARRLSHEQQSPLEPRASSRVNEKLTRCVACGTWLPASRVIALRSSSATYCSHACLERAAGDERKTKAWKR